jgi:hypothetical protein
MATNIILIFAIILLGILVTVFTLDSWSSLLYTSVLLTIISYIFILGIDRLTTYSTATIKEGFLSDTKGEQKGDKPTESEANKSKYEWLVNEDLFDDFYASVFTKLTQNEKLIQAETAMCMEEFTKKTPKDQLNILDAGCGIGIATTSFAKLGAGQVTGIDRSQAMIRYAKSTTLPSTTLTDIERQNVEFRQMDLIGPGAAAAAEFTDACLLYFTVYYFRDLDNLFRNLARRH